MQKKYLQFICLGIMFAFSPSLCTLNCSEHDNDE